MKRIAALKKTWRKGLREAAKWRRFLEVSGEVGRVAAVAAVIREAREGVTGEVRWTDSPAWVRSIKRDPTVHCPVDFVGTRKLRPTFSMGEPTLVGGQKIRKAGVTYYKNGDRVTVLELE